MNILLKERVKLIRAMQKAAKAIAIENKSKEDDVVLQEIISKIRSDFNNHFLSVSQEAPMQVSYCRKVEDKYNNVRRVRTSLGRYISKNMGVNIKHYLLDVFVGKTWAFYFGETINVEIFKGNKIIQKYKEFESTSDSCMTGENAYLTKFYAVNPDKVCLVCYDEIRALLWTSDSGEKILDRCYPSGNFKVHILRNWALSKGYLLRENLGMCEDSIVPISGNKICKITMKETDYETFPYLDTFCFGQQVTIKAKNGRVMNRIELSNEASIGCYEFRATDGGYYDDVY